MDMVWWHLPQKDKLAALVSLGYYGFLPLLQVVSKGSSVGFGVKLWPPELV